MLKQPSSFKDCIRESGLYCKLNDRILIGLVYCGLSVVTTFWGYLYSGSLDKSVIGAIIILVLSIPAISTASLVLSRFKYEDLKQVFEAENMNSE